MTLLWRNEQFAAPFVRSLAGAAGRAHTTVELVAVQNGPDGLVAAELVEQETGRTENVRLVRKELQRNVGFAGGMNVGCALATGDPIVAANLDLEFDVEFLVALERASHLLAQAAFLAPSVRAPGPGDEVGALRRDRLHRPAQARRQVAGLHRAAAGNGSCLVFGAALLACRRRAVGGLFDGEYHSYYEDVDLFWWAAAAEVPVWFAPELRVVHHQGGSVNGQFRFRDRAPEWQSSIIANYRLTVWKNARRLVDVAGWLAGEFGYATLCTLGAGRGLTVRGLSTYARSWRLTLLRTRAIRARRGSLRVRRAHLDSR